MLKLLKSLFSSSASGSSPSVEEPFVYKGFKITPSPKSISSGWSTEATIEKEVDGELRVHHFIRADHSSSKDGAIELITNKCQMTVDQLGDKIFK